MSPIKPGLSAVKKKKKKKFLTEHGFCPSRLPFYYELKIAFVVWLLSPYTKGSSVLYRKFVHPTLSSKEKDIDEYICQAKDKSYDTLVHFGRKGLNVAATAAVMAAAKGQGVLSDRLRSFSMQDLSSYQSDPDQTGPSAAQPTAAQHRTRPIIRSKSESYKGESLNALLLLQDRKLVESTAMLCFGIHNTSFLTRTLIKSTLKGAMNALPCSHRPLRSRLRKGRGRRCRPRRAPRSSG
uniref:Receptor expression-enhancing protein n=1 Tax=Poecilia mexicana TaxID=48701 RepID=A0A3B3WL87_9TELE